MLADLDSGAKGSVLLVAFFFPPENTSGAARPFRFYKYLPRFGYGVQVLTASPQDPNHVSANVVRVADTVQNPERRILQSLVRRVLGPFVAEESLTWIFRACEGAEQVVLREKICAVFSTSSPMTSHIVGGRLKQRYGIPWIADFRDPLVGDPFRKNAGIPGYLDRFLQEWIFRRADALIATTDATLELWKRQYPEYGKKMHLIWNGFDPEDVLEAVAVPQREYKLLVHVGHVYGIRHPGVLLSSLRRLIQRGLLPAEKFRVQLVGPLAEGWSHDPQQVEELFRLGCLQYDGRLVSRKEAGQAMTGADVLILLDSHAVDGSLQVPAKIFDYVRIGRPILAVTTQQSPVDRLLARSGVPYAAIYPEDPGEEVDQKVLALLKLPSEPVIASEWFWEQFDAAPQARELASLIASLERKVESFEFAFE